MLACPCAICGTTLEHPLSGAVCETCWASVVRFAPPSNAIGEYDGTLRDIIHALKYDGRRSTASRLAAMMKQQGAALLADAAVVVPVPLHPKRERERGFNQAEDLARGLGLPVARMLRRIRSTKPQVDLAADERRRNVKDAFEVLPGWSNRLRQGYGGREEQPPQVLVLVDDVTTTGATLEACARVLKQAGVREVRTLTAARVSSVSHS